MKFLFTILFTLLSLPGLCQEDDDKLLKEIEATRRKQVETAIKLDQARQGIQQTAINSTEQARKFGNVSVLFDEKLIKMLQQSLKAGPLTSISEQQVRELILTSVEGKPIHALYLKHPKLLDLMVDILRDKDASSSLLGLLLRKDDLKKYLYIWIGLFILALIIRRLFFSKGWGPLRRVLMNVVMIISFMAVSLTVFYNMFEDELAPSAKIIVRHLQKKNS